MHLKFRQIDKWDLSAQEARDWGMVHWAAGQNIGQFLQCRLFYDCPLFCGEINFVPLSKKREKLQNL